MTLDGRQDVDQPGSGERPCAICGRPAAPATRPFCSARCADVDLHRWLAGAYATPAAADDDDPGADPGDEDG